VGSRLVAPLFLTRKQTSAVCPVITECQSIYVMALRVSTQIVENIIMLVDGKWTAEWQPVQAKDEKGGFVRQVSSFRHWVTPDGSAGLSGDGGFKAEAGRYHLYVALICPWASRALLARKLKGLEQAVSLSIVEPVLTQQGWRFGEFPGSTPDTVNGATYIHEIYTRAEPHFTGRATVPVLWDKVRNTIVNNESADIVRMFNRGFGTLAAPGYDLYPVALRSEIDAFNDRLYSKLNNGVYRTGFATTQVAYEEAFWGVFEMLEELERRLADNRPFIFGRSLTETDIRAFVTLIRFDAAYHGLFKANLRRVADYASLTAYLQRMLAIPGVRETVNIDHIKRGYYSIKALNPTGIVPLGPDLPLFGQLKAAA
jgi:putative glutathione S-transferase